MAESEVQKASDQFYTALNNLFKGETVPMSEIWSHAPDVTQLGPFGRILIGWENVKEDFQHAADMVSDGNIVAKDVLIRICGDMGYTICTEVGENIDRKGNKIFINHRATNIFRRESGVWKLVHHHTDISPALQAVAEQKY